MSTMPTGPTPVQQVQHGAMSWPGDDGYDRMAWAENHGWKCISGWGRDGWDMLEWPYYCAYIWRDPAVPKVATDCEGDIDIWTFQTREECVKHLDCLAFWKWHTNGDSWVEGMPMFGTWEEIPTHLRGPYSSDRHESPINPVEEAS